MKSNPVRVHASRASMVTPWWWLVLAVLFVSFAGLSYWQTKRGLVQEQEQLAINLSQKLLAPMVLNDPNYAQHILDFLKDQPGVVSARLVDANGGVVAAFDPLGQSDQFALAQLGDGRSRFERSELLVMSPVSVGSQVLGNVHMRVDTSPNFADAMSTTTVVFGLLAMGLFWIQSQGISLRIAPKEHPSQAAKRQRAWRPPNQAVHDALEEAGISMRYVPITDVKCGGLRGVEAMVYWARPNALPVHVSTAEFLGLAEKNDLVLPFEDWALKTAMSQVANWHQAHGSLALSFNITASQFNNGSFPQRVRDLCQAFGLPLQAVSLEIHEGVLAHMSPQQMLNVQAFARQGLPLTIDGFGSTSHAHSLLRQTGLAAVKFDKRLLAQSDHGDVLSARLQELAVLANTQQIAICAEGARSVEQERAVGLLGCTTCQGMGSYQSLASNTLDAILLNPQATTGSAQPWLNTATSGAIEGL